MTQRYNFDYWPPLPLEHQRVAPAQSSPSEELAQGLLYIDNEPRRLAVLATKEWVDIEDFWYDGASAPKPDQVFPEGVLSRTTLLGETALRVRSKRHLQNATYTFQRLARELACLYDDKDPIDEHPVLKVLGPHGSVHVGDTRAEQFLFHHAFFQNDKRYPRTNVLIARQVVYDIFDHTEPLPIGVGKDGQAVLAKVALKWNSTIKAL